MTAWPPIRNGLVETLGATTATTTGVTLASSLTQIIASTSYAYKGLIVMASDNGGAKTTFDIGVGAAAAEAKIVTQMLFGLTNGSLMNEMYYIPIAVAKGSRISMLSSSGTLKVVVYGIVDNFDGLPGFQKLENVGTSSGAGTGINTGTTVNTKVAYVQLSASTTYTWGGIILAFSETSAASSNGSFLVDIAVGAAAAESVLLSNIAAEYNATLGRMMKPVCLGPFNCAVPKSSRISFRAQGSSGTNGNTFDLGVYGLVS